MLIAFALLVLQPADITIKTDYYTLTAPAGHDEDAAAMQKALDRGIESIKKQFAPFDASQLLQKATVTIQIHGKADDRAAPGHAQIESGTTDGTAATYYANMHILAPSAHPADGKTSVNEPMNSAYCERIIVHEYSTVLLEMICRDRGQGWTFFSAPAWFIQGYEEYLGLTCGNAEAGKVTLSKYIARVKANPKWISCDFGLEISEPYTTGPVLLHFMHEKYGGERVRAILFRSAPTFGKAVREALGIGADQFCADWSTWIAAQP
jgi:hypothetical protein